MYIFMNNRKVNWGGDYTSNNTQQTLKYDRTYKHYGVTCMFFKLQSNNDTDDTNEHHFSSMWHHDLIDVCGQFNDRKPQCRVRFSFSEQTNAARGPQPPVRLKSRFISSLLNTIITCIKVFTRDSPLETTFI